MAKTILTITRTDEQKTFLKWGTLEEGISFVRVAWFGREADCVIHRAEELFTLLSLDGSMSWLDRSKDELADLVKVYEGAEVILN